MVKYFSPLNLPSARILLSNDDGIHAPGLALLERVARSLCDDVWVVAPETEQSATSHSLTIHRPLRLKQLGEKRYICDGTPTDCVLLAINHLITDRKPTLVLSGINQGANIGEDVTYSGTIAAAMEATLLNVPAIALSQQYDNGFAVPWATAEQWAATVIRKIANVAWPQGVLMNVNFPPVAADAVTGIHVVRHGKRKLGDELVARTDPRGRPYIWIGALRGCKEVAPDTDIAVVNGGGIAITPLSLDLTHHATLAPLARAVACDPV